MVITCPVCLGRKSIFDPDEQMLITCPTCRGTGIVIEKDK